MIQVANRVSVEPGYSHGNVGLIGTGEGAILVDVPMLPAEARAWRERVLSLQESALATGEAGIAYLITTTCSPARFLGSYHYDAPVVAHESAWRELRARGQTMLQRQIDAFKRSAPEVSTALADIEVVLPQVAIVDQATIHRGERKIEIIHLGGHTSASLAVLLPDEGILFSGDLVVEGGHPDLSLAESGQWVEALDRIAEMDVELIVPGLGNPSSPDVVPPLRAYVAEMRETVREQHAKGASRRETVDKVRTEFGDRYPIDPAAKDAAQRRIRSSAERLYEEARKGLL